MKTRTFENHQPTVAARVAGEDIAVDSFVTVLSEIYELPSFLWNCSDVSLPADEPVRLRLPPHNDGMPSKVISVCLPYVYVKYANGCIEAFDTRRQQLVRLDDAAAMRVWRKLRRPFRRQKKRNRKRKAKRSKD